MGLSPPGPHIESRSNDRRSSEALSNKPQELVVKAKGVSVARSDPRGGSYASRPISASRRVKAWSRWR